MDFLQIAGTWMGGWVVVAVLAGLVSLVLADVTYYVLTYSLGQRGFTPHEALKWAGVWAAFAIVVGAAGGALGSWMRPRAEWGAAIGAGLLSGAVLSFPSSRPVHEVRVSGWSSAVSLIHHNVIGSCILGVPLSILVALLWPLHARHKGAAMLFAVLVSSVAVALDIFVLTHIYRPGMIG